MNDSEISAKRLHELVRYNRQTGEFTWRVLNRWRKPGPIGTLHHGYLVARFDDRLYRLHRLAWLYVTGEMPPEETDHINGRRSDNRFVNLRLSSHAQNQQNRPKNKNNDTGYKGVSFCQSTGRWRATISAHGKTKSIGRFDTKQEAYDAYCKAARDLHGPFASF